MSALALIAATMVSTEKSTASPPSLGGEIAAAPDPGRVEEMATATSDTYRQPDGSYEFVGYTTPVNYLTDDGSWAPIDNELVPAAGDVYAVENAENDYTVKIPEDAGTDPVKITTDNQWLTFGMDGLDGTPVVEGAEATYTQANAADASEVIYEARPDGVKESIVLNQPPPAGVEYTFDLRLSVGLAPRLRATGAIDIVDTANRPVFTMPAPFMTDANNAVSTNVSYELTQTATGWQLSVTPADSWLQDPARAYPVIVDPTVTKNPSTDGWITEANPTQVNAGGPYLRVGGTTGVRRRALLKFDLASIPTNAEISSSTLRLFLDAGLTTGTGASTTGLVAGRVKSTQTWTPGWLSWNNREYQTAWETPGGAWDSTSPVSTIDTSISNFKYIDVLLATQRWVNESWANNGFIVKQNTNDDWQLWFHSVNTTTGNEPRFVVNYTVPDHPPATPTDLAITPGGTGYTTSPSPTFSVAVKDPDGSAVDTTFRVLSGTEVMWEGTDVAVASPGTATAQLETGALDPGEDYTLEVTSSSNGLTSIPLTTSLRSDTPAADIVPATSSCTPLCTAVAPTTVYDGTIAAKSTVAATLASLPVDIDDVGGVRARVAISGDSSSGAIAVYNSDYPTPVARSFSYGVSGTATQTVDVRSSITNDISLTNMGSFPLRATVTVTAWYPWEAPEEAAADAATEDMEPTDVEIEEFLAEQPETSALVEAISGGGCNPDTLSAGQTMSCIEQVTPEQFEAEIQETASSEGSKPTATTLVERASLRSSCRQYPNVTLLRYRFCTTADLKVIEWKRDDDGVKHTTGGALFQLKWTVETNPKSQFVNSTARFTYSRGWRSGETIGWTTISYCRLACFGVPDYVDYVAMDSSGVDLSASSPRETVEAEGYFDYRKGNNNNGRALISLRLWDRNGDIIDFDRFGSSWIKCDHASYLGETPGCVFEAYEPIFHLTRPTTDPAAKYPESAKHIYFAHWKRNPKITAGRYAHTQQGVPLRRKIWSGTNLNHKAARIKCGEKYESLGGLQYLRDNNLDCDEYPFQSTREGCFEHYRMCSVRGIPHSDNRGSGAKYGIWLKAMRIKGGDKFWVWIH